MARRIEDFGYLSRQDYLAAERVAPFKSEWVDGVVYAMAGASKRHVQAVSVMSARFAAAALDHGCLYGTSDLMVQTELANYYPDVVVTCDPSDDPYIELNPCFIAEVLSPSTGRSDRHEKRDAYLTIASMKNYWIVDADNHVVEAWEREGTGWTGRHRRANEALTVECLGLTLPVADLFG